MKKSIFLIPAFILTLISAPAIAQGGPEEPPEQESPAPIPFGFDLVPYAGTSSALPDSPRYFSLNLIGGISGGSRILEIAGALNIASGPVTGVQIAGATNIVGDDMQGAQVAGAANVVAGSTQGLGVGGAVNIIAGHNQGARIGGAANIIGKTTQGALIAGALNLIGDDAQGLQIAGATNISARNTLGAQISGALNLTRQDMQGLQIAPVNFTGGDVQGLQVGVINIARTSTASIGLIGIYFGGFVQPEFYLSEDGLLLAGIRHGSGNFYNIYSLGTRLFGGPDDLGPAIAASLGFGYRVAINDPIELSFDLTTTSTISETRDWNWKSHFNFFKLRPMISVSLLDSVTIFGGPTLALSLPSDDSTLSAQDFALFEGWHLGKDVHLWPGFVLGARFF